MRQPLIASIDPGTTLGYALLDLQENILCVASSRTLDMGILLPILTEKGKPFIIATDKKEIPQFVQTIATQLGAVVFHPDNDLSKEEKRKLTLGVPLSNDHEQDALAAALFALQRYKPLFLRIDKTLKRLRKDQFADAVKAYVVLHPGINIRLAADLITTQDKIHKARLQRIIDTKQTEEDVQYLYRQITELENKHFLLEDERENMQERIYSLQREIKRSHKKLQTITQAVLTDRKIKEKDMIINQLRLHLHQHQNQLQAVTQQFHILQQLICDYDQYVLVKKIPSLGFHKDLHLIREGDVLLIDDPHIFSEQVVTLLREKIGMIIHKKPLTQKQKEHLPFYFLSAEALPIIEFPQFAFVSRQAYLAQKAKLNMLDIVLREYQQEREKP